MNKQCPLCERRIGESFELCDFHQTALKNLENAYINWKNAYGVAFSKELCFEKLEALAETGEAVKDVIQYLRKKGVQH
jgi:hypothetical protein